MQHSAAGKQQAHECAGSSENTSEQRRAPLREPPATELSASSSGGAWVDV